MKLINTCSKRPYDIDWFNHYSYYEKVKQLTVMFSRSHLAYESNIIEKDLKIILTSHVEHISKNLSLPFNIIDLECYCFERHDEDFQIKFFNDIINNQTTYSKGRALTILFKFLKGHISPELKLMIL